ncbi:hypothetical protein ANTRET_LOCUS6677 [Anthophora retusa]
MELKRTRLEIIDTDKRYNNPDQTGDSGFTNFWKIFLTLFITLIVIVVFITCYRYIYGKIIYICKRCIVRRNEESIDDNSSTIKETKNSSYMKRHFLWPDKYNLLTSHTKSDGQRNNKCKLKTLLQEKKKLLSSRENKIATSTNNIDLTKQLSLKLWNTDDLDKYRCEELKTQNVKNLRENSHQSEKNTCFSDMSLKLLVIPLSPKKSNRIKEEEGLLLCKWNSENIIQYSKNRNNTSSKLIELNFENADSFSDRIRENKISNFKLNCLPCPSFPDNLATESKYFSDSATNKSENLPNMFRKRSKRSIVSYTNSTLSSTSNTVKTENDRILNMNSETDNTSLYITDKNNPTKTDELKEIMSQASLNEYNVYPKKIHKEIKSSGDILNSQIKEAKEAKKKSKFDENLADISLIRDASTDFFTDKNFISTPKKLVCSSKNILSSKDRNSEISETYDELGILFSQYIKLQTQQCQRKYCPLKRHLKRKMQHSVKKCQTRFNYYQIYPYDQRPTCNNGNVCTDTYDELKLMCITPSERKNIYERMFKRRKHFLNQSYTLSNRNSLTAGRS